MLPVMIIHHAFKEIKRMQCDDRWEGDYRSEARDALKKILESCMDINRYPKGEKC